MFRDIKERLNGPKNPTDFSMTSLRFKRNNPSRLFFPSQEDLFKENNRNKMRELILRSKLDLCSRYGAREDDDKNRALWPVKQLFALPYSFQCMAPKDSRRSTMCLVAEMKDGNVYPTTSAIDPYFRAPILGKFEDYYEFEEEEESSEEIGRGGEKI